MTKSIEIGSISDKAFISSYHSKFKHYLNCIDDHTRQQIHNNKQLNDFYDLFLDYIIDSAEYLNKKS